MADFLISRHEGTVKWLALQGVTAERLDELDGSVLRRIGPDDRVFGNLPPPIVAEVGRTGARYFHILLPRQPLGAELDADAMEAAGARLVEVRAWCPDRPPASPRKPAPGALRPSEQLRTFLLAFLAVVLTGFALDVAYTAVVRVFTPHVGAARLPWAFLALVMLFVAFLSAWLLWSQRHRLLDFSIRIVPHPRPRRAVILGLSPLRPPRGTAAEAAEAWFKDQVAAIGRLDLSEIALEEDAFGAAQAGARTPERKAAFAVASGSWQQAFRIMAAQLPRLEIVVMICSAGEDGSHRQFDAFAELANGLLAKAGSGVEIACCPGPPVDFQDHAELREAFRCAVEELNKRGISAGDIVIDVTPGTKLYSIAAAAVTLNNDSPMAYVDNAGRVSVYDAQVALAEIE